jgi:RNA polymerase sigma-70 factor (ECF subfamily)
MEEKELIERLKRNDRKAQEEFVRKYSGFLFNVALQILRRKDLAEDVAEDTLLIGLKKIGSFRGKSKLSTWLYRIASNRAKQVILSEMRKDALKEKIADSPDANDFVPSEYKKSRKKEIIWKGMEFLKDSDREIITLVDIQNLKYEEVAEILGVPIGTVRSRISRARERLKKIIEERNFFEGELSNK